MRFRCWLTLIGTVLVLAACGGGGGTTAGLSGGGTGGGGGAGAAQPRLTMSLSATQASVGSPITVTATLRDESNAPVGGALVTFSTDANFGLLDPTSGTALTNASGVATIQLHAGPIVGAAQLNAQAVYRKNGQDVTVSGAINYQSAGGGAPSIAGTLTRAGSPVSSISPGQPATLTVVVRDETNTPVSGALVTLSTDNRGQLSETSQLTNASGVASVTLSAGSAVGASQVQIQASYRRNGRNFTASNIIFYRNESTAAPSLTLRLTDDSGNDIAGVTATLTGTVRALVRDANNNPVAGALVVFTTDPQIGTLDPASGSAITNGSGLATIRLSPGTVSGAATLRARATYTSGGQDVQLTHAINYSAAVATPPEVTLSDLVFGAGAGPLSAYGSTSVSVTVGGVSGPATVTFTSACAAQGKAFITAQATTVDGVATASYRDNGCAGTDTITASVLGKSRHRALAVATPSVGSIQFISASPQHIALRGTGGAGRSETAVVKFKVLDQAGNPIARTVNFSLSTTQGGLALTNTSANSDAVTGEVQTIVQAGTRPTPVRVTATVQGTGISTQSDQLSVSSGIPDQAHFSIAVSTFNIEGWDIDGRTTTLTARLADHFGNPVPDGTVVNFIAEGGRIGTGTQGSCNTVNSECSVTFTAQAIKPSDGRVTILAYAVGNEAFTDLNGDGRVNSHAERVDANLVGTDLPEAWLDGNENGIRDAGETFVDYNANGSYDFGDGRYTGMLCDSSVSGLCSTANMLHIFRGVVVVLSGSEAVVNVVDGDNVIPTFDLGGCNPGMPGRTYNLAIRVRDSRGNPMPAGTAISITTTNGTIVYGASHTVPNGTGGTGSNPFSANPDASIFRYPFELKNDAPTVGTCLVDPTPTGNLRVTVTTPSGRTTVHTIPVIN